MNIFYVLAGRIFFVEAFLVGPGLNSCTENEVCLQTLLHQQYDRWVNLQKIPLANVAKFHAQIQLLNNASLLLTIFVNSVKL